MAGVRKSIGLFVVGLLMLGCLAIAPLLKTDVAVADTGLTAATPSLQTQKSYKPNEKLKKEKLYVSGTSIYFVWNKAAASDWRYGQTGYCVQVSTKSSMAGAKKNITYNWNYNGFVKNNTKANTRYYFRVCLFNKVNGKYYFGPWSKKYSIMRKDNSNSGSNGGSSGSKASPYTPTQKLKVSASAGNKKMKVSYSQASNWITNGGGSNAKTSGYEIWWTNSTTNDNTIDWSNKFVKFVKDQYTTTVNLKSLTNGTRYFVSVRLYNTVNGVTYTGPWSDVATCIPKSSLAAG